MNTQALNKKKKAICHNMSATKTVAECQAESRRKYAYWTFIYTLLVVYLIGVFVGGIALLWHEFAVWAWLPAFLVALVHTIYQYQEYDVWLYGATPDRSHCEIPGVHKNIRENLQLVLISTTIIIGLYALVYGVAAYQKDINPEMLGGGMLLLFLAILAFSWYKHPIFLLQAIAHAKSPGINLT